MPMQKIPKEDILGVFAKVGPCQPIDIRKELKLGDTFLIGAMLSEMVSEGTLMISKVRRGGSPFYYDPNVPERLDQIAQYLNEKDRRTYAMLKEQKVMREDSQDPLVRVGLQNMADFSKRIEIDGVMYWRYFLTTEDEARKLVRKEEKIDKETKEKEVKREMKEEEKIEENKEESAPELKPKKKAKAQLIDAQDASAEKIEKPKKTKKKLSEPVIMPDGAVMISPQEWLTHDTLYEKVEKFAAGMNIRDARVHKPHGELTCIISLNTPFGIVDTFVHAFARKFTADDIKESMPRARELGLPIVILSVDAIPTKVTSQFKGMPNILFKKFE